MPRRPHSCLVLLALVVCVGCGRNRYADRAPALGPENYVIAPDDVPAPGQHIRYAKSTPGKPGGLDIAVTEFHAKEGGVPVFLVGAVHVADPPFFDAVQRELDRHAIVLYEGVKPAHMTAAEWQDQVGERGGKAAQLQKTLAGWFGLEYQLDGIDYTRPNLVHADMTMETFLEEGGGKFVPVAPRRPGGGAAPDADTNAVQVASSSESPGDLSASAWRTWQAVKSFGDVALGRPGPLRSLARQMFAETLGTVDMGRALEMRPGMSELILHKRNEVVIEKLREVLPTATGSIAIFYGAAHMPDLEKRLEKELAYARTGGRWIRAWAVRAPLTR